MAGYDFTYTIGMNAEFAEATRKVEAFNKDLQSRNFDIKLDLAGYDNIGEVDKQLKKLGISTQELKNVTVETKTFIDAQGKSHQEVTKLIGDHVNAYGKLEKVTTVVNSKYKESQDSLKKYDNLLKSTDTTLQGLQNVEGKHKDALQKTATELNNAVSKWKAIAEQYGVGSAEAKKAEAEIDRLSKTIKEQAGATKTGAAGLQSWSTTAERVIKQSFAYAIAMRVIRKAQQELNKAIKFTVDLNTEMTKIKVLQVEGAKTTSQINALADSYNRLAQEMGASTLEVAKGSVEWLRQGKTIEETGELLKSTIMLSKLGNMESADATEKLTSTLNGYSMAASEATSVVDKLVAVDNVAATSTKELAVALQYSAAVANQTGVSFEQLVSYIATVSETTRQNAESIGQGMKTMLTRMQDIKAGKIDEDGLGINNVEIALKKANMSLRDAQGNWRDFGTVLEELSGKWSTLSDIERSYISKSIAGVRQINIFTVLMEKMGRAIELQEVQFNSAGLAADRYQIYLDSLQAKIDIFKATLEGLYQQAVSSEFLSDIVDLGTGILKLIEDMGGLKSVILALGTAFAVMKLPGIIANVTSLGATLSALLSGAITIPTLFGAIGSTATAASGGLTLASGAAVSAATAAGTLSVALGGILAGVAILGFAISKFIVTLKEQREATKEAFEQAQDSAQQAKAASDTLSQIKSLAAEYEELSKVQVKTLEQKKRLTDVQNELNELSPGTLLGYYDEEQNFIIEKIGNMEQIIALLEEELALKREMARLDAVEAAKAANALSVKAKRDLANKKERRDEIYGYMEFDDPVDYATTKTEEYKEKFGVAPPDEYFGSWIEKYNTFIANKASYLEELDALDKEIKQAEIDINADRTKSLQAFVSLSEYNMSDALAFYDTLAQESAGREEILKYIREYQRSDPYPDEQGAPSQETVDNTLTNYDNLIKKVENYKKILDELAENGPSAVSSAELQSAFGATAADLELVNGKWQISKEKTAAAKQELSDEIDLIREANPALAEYIESLFSVSEATDEVADAHDRLMSRTDAFISALEEQNTKGVISAETAFEIAQANGELAESLVEVEGGYRLTDEAIASQTNALQNSLNTIIADAEAGKYNATVKQIMGEVAAHAAEGNYILAMSAAEAGRAALEEAGIFKYLSDILNKFAQISFTMPSFSGGGSSAKQENPAIKENEELIEQIEDLIKLEEDKIKLIEDEIKLEEEKIDALEKVQDEYEDWIDQKKESLELAKEESDYYKEQQKDLKSLADIRKQIALLEFDTSEEATAKRQELEAEAAEMEEDIAEKAEDRRHELQMQALDNLQKSFESMIEKQIEGIQAIIDAKEDQIDVIKDGIDIFKEQIEGIRDIIEDLRDQGRSGGGSGYSGGSGGSGGTYNPNGTNNQGGWTTDPQGHPIFINPNEGILQEPFNPNGTHANQNSVDYAMDAGSNVAAEQTGVIKAAWVGEDYGETMVLVDPKSGIATQYYHLAPGTVAKYKDQVGKGIIEAGQVFAQTGITGNVGDIAHLGVRKGEWDSETGRLVQTEEINKYYRDLIDLGIIPTIDALRDFSLTSIPQANQSVTNFGVKVVNATGKVDEELTATANSLAENGVLTQRGFEDVEAALRNGGITLDDGISGVMEDLAYLGIGAGLTGQGLIELYQFIMDSAKNISEGGDQTTFTPFVPSSYTATGALKPGFAPHTPRIVKHDGGLVESHHNGEFAGGLQSNEVFAKLLKGEYVATEHQMDNFLRNVLPSIGSNMPKVTSNIGGQNINVSMPITVEGNLDKSVIPDIKNIANQVIAEINRSLVSRGYVRPANQTIS